MSKLAEPIITEKANLLAEAGVYAFRVENSANKLQIKKEVEKLYKVSVRMVNIVHVLPKKRIFRGRVGQKPGYKKALVFLKKGEKIDLV